LHDIYAFLILEGELEKTLLELWLWTSPYRDSFL